MIKSLVMLSGSHACIVRVFFKLLLQFPGLLRKRQSYKWRCKPRQKKIRKQLLPLFFSLSPSIRFCNAIWELIWTRWGIVSGNRQKHGGVLLGGWRCLLMMDSGEGEVGGGLNFWPSAGNFLKIQLPHVRASPKLGLNLRKSKLAKNIKPTLRGKQDHQPHARGVCVRVCVRELCKFVD